MYGEETEEEKAERGVLIKVHKILYVEEVQQGDRLTEVLSITIQEWQRKEKNHGCICATNDQYMEIQSKVLKCLDKMLRTNKKVLLMRDLNWEEMELNRYAGQQGEVLQLAIDNTLD